MVWLGLALIIILVAAALLICIYLEARGILGHAGRALAAGRRIEANTRILRAIPDVNTTLGDTNEALVEVARHTRSLANALPDRGQHPNDSGNKE